MFVEVINTAGMIVNSYSLSKKALLIMSNIQVKDPYMGKPTFYKYESGDRQILVDLLHEYSEKLILVSDKLVIAKKMNIRRNFIVATMILIVLVLIFHDLSRILLPQTNMGRIYLLGITINIILLISTQIGRAHV